MASTVSSGSAQNSYPGVVLALALGKDERPQATVFKEFALDDRVALVTGGHRGLGLEMSLALIEAGARAVYCVDLPEEPSEEWKKVKDYASRMEGKGGEGRLEYFSANVTDQKRMWEIGDMIGGKEGRLDICIAAAGIGSFGDSLSLLADDHEKVIDINANGVLFAAQSAGRQMVRFGTGGSIVLVASLLGSIASKGMQTLSYATAKGAVLQMTRSLSCELAPQGIRVNSLSPGWIQTNMIASLIERDPSYFEREVPMKRVGQPHELRGVTVWLCSDASSFCTGSDIKVSGGLHAW